MRKLSNDQVEEVLRLYQQGENSTQLASRFGVSHVAIYGLLNRRGIKLRNHSEAARKCELRQDAFATITSESAYWIGFLMADGSISTSRNELSCMLTEIDRGHLEKLRDFLGSNHALVNAASRPSGRYQCRPLVRFAFDPSGFAMIFPDLALWQTRATPHPSVNWSSAGISGEASLTEMGLWESFVGPTETIFLDWN